MNFGSLNIYQKVFIENLHDRCLASVHTMLRVSLGRETTGMEVIDKTVNQNSIYQN